MTTKATKPPSPEPPKVRLLTWAEFDKAMDAVCEHMLAVVPKDAVEGQGDPQDGVVGIGIGLVFAEMVGRILLGMRDLKPIDDRLKKLNLYDSLNG